jgi:hypothetical protein
MKCVQQGNTMHGVEGVRRYSVFLLYWFKSTNTDAVRVRSVNMDPNAKTFAAPEYIKIAVLSLLALLLLVQEYKY